jgi:hypothetical protein
MKLGELKKFKKNLQGKLYFFVYFLCSKLSRPKTKFVMQMIQGIIKSQSCILRKVAKSLDEKITVKKTSERLRNHLSMDGLHQIISMRILKKSARRIDKDTIIVMDDSDLIKNEAEKMEGLSKVPDGSKNHKRGLGYKLINVAAVNSHGENEAEIIPLQSELYSNKIEMDSCKNILFNQINDILVSTKGQGIFTCDRYYDDRILFKELADNDADFIIRAKNNRNLIYQGNLIHFKTLIKSVRPTETIKAGKEIEIEAGAVRVEIPVDPHPRKNPQTVDAWLIVGRYTKKPKTTGGGEVISLEKGGYFYLYVSIRHLNNDKKAMILKSLKGYRLRWKIEEFHRQVKQDFGWEDMQLMDYTRLKNMNALLLAAVWFVYQLYRMRLTLYKVFPRIMSDRKRDIDKLVFIYYRITEVVNYIFNSWKLMFRKRYKGQYAEYLQMRLKF